jgi:hypothetical protein
MEYLAMTTNDCGHTLTLTASCQVKEARRARQRTAWLHLHKTPWLRQSRDRRLWHCQGNGRRGVGNACKEVGGFLFWVMEMLWHCIVPMVATFFFLFWSTGVWTQSLYLEQLHQPFLVMGFIETGSHRTICLNWLQTMILLIAISWVARITGMSQRRPASQLTNTVKTTELQTFKGKNFVTWKFVMWILLWERVTKTQSKERQS